MLISTFPYTDMILMIVIQIDLHRPNANSNYRYFHASSVMIINALLKAPLNQIAKKQQQKILSV